MAALVWVVEGTWPACVEAVRARAADDEVTLLYVVRSDIEHATQGALAGLMGRRHRPHHRPPGPTLGEAGGADLLAEAADALGRPADTRVRSGRVEREVVAEAEGFDLLVVARDGDHARLGPHSLGPDTRFVVDHAPCPVLLVWPGETPAVADIPPPPDHPPGHHPH